MGGTVVIRPDTAITHVIYDGRSAALLARELGLDTLSELPEGTVCVKWDWVVKCKMAVSTTLSFFDSDCETMMADLSFGQNKVLETGPWLSFQKTAFNRAFSSNAAIREGSRMRDITTELLRGRSISITK
jgi:DNA polymerase lambda